MFTKTVHLNTFPITVVVRGFPIQKSWEQNHWVALRSAQPLILPGSVKWVPGTPQEWVVKIKLSLQSGSVALRQLNPIHKKGP